MSDVTGILGSIDGALRDCTVSADAMRWAPEGEQAPEATGTDAAARAFGQSGAWAREVLAVSGFGSVPLAGASITLGRPFEFAAAERRTGMPLRSLPEFGGTFTGEFYPGALERLTGVSPPAQPPAADLAAAIRGMFEDIGRALRPLFAWCVKFAHDVHRALYPGRHKRCATCCPGRKPKPLAVDGHAYRRRQRNRVKSRR